MSRIAPPAAGAILVSSPAELRPRRLTLTRWSGHRTAAILVTWWVFLGGLHAAWLARDTRPPHWDAAVHLLSSLRYRQALAGFFSGSAGLAATIERLFSVDAYYPPFAPFIGSLLTPGFRPSAASSTWALNQFFLALLILGTFRLGSRVGGPVSGLAAAVAVTTFGGICSASHAFMLDLPLAAMTVLSLDALAGTDGFARSRRSLVFGLLCGVGMLTKWTFLFFLLAPTVAELATLRRFSDPGRRLRNAAAALLVSAAVALPWYLVHAPNLAQEIVHFGGFSRADGSHFPAVWSVQSLAFYPRSVAELLLLPWVAALAVGLALCWRRLRRATETRTYSRSSAALLCSLRTAS
jgi:4-amino-4-deoxy-L-arabinose transferase-like glycosyltransferase